MLLKWNDKLLVLTDMGDDSIQENLKSLISLKLLYSGLDGFHPWILSGNSCQNLGFFFFM